MSDRHDTDHKFYEYIGALVEIAVASFPSDVGDSHPGSYVLGLEAVRKFWTDVPSEERIANQLTFWHPDQMVQMATLEQTAETYNPRSQLYIVPHTKIAPFQNNFGDTAPPVGAFRGRMPGFVRHHQSIQQSHSPGQSLA